MSNTVSLTEAKTEPPPLTESADGTIRIANTRIPLEREIRAFQSGATPLPSKSSWTTMF